MRHLFFSTRHPSLPPKEGMAANFIQYSLSSFSSRRHSAPGGVVPRSAPSRSALGVHCLGARGRPRGARMALPRARPRQHQAPFHPPRPRHGPRAAPSSHVAERRWSTCCLSTYCTGPHCLREDARWGGRVGGGGTKAEIAGWRCSTPHLNFHQCSARFPLLSHRHHPTLRTPITRVCPLLLGAC